ncbi:MAG: hypothetical protein HY423_06815 [Candidatus Lambdaproteobacteria bacterium]|nr:hypothetical protein [Candidatus Lambdaproteobacteria bacterium]
MAQQQKRSQTVRVDPFPLPVLGGAFLVREVVAQPGQGAPAAVAALKASPSDRWFVMAEESEGEARDALAVLDMEDDRLEVVIHAKGTFTPE